MSQRRRKPKPQDPTCESCGKPATRRFHLPSNVTKELCDECSSSVESYLNDAGIRTETVGPMSRAAKVAAQVDMHDVKKRTTWIARSKVEYERAVELGLVAGWSSWEEYEHETLETIRLSGNRIDTLDFSPDDIVKLLKEHNLPNTSEGRSRLFAILSIVREAE